MWHMVKYGLEWTDKTWINKTWTDKIWINKTWIDKTWIDKSWINKTWSDKTWINKTWIDKRWIYDLIRKGVFLGFIGYEYDKHDLGMVVQSSSCFPSRNISGRK